jgi:hypothetical protein
MSNFNVDEEVDILVDKLVEQFKVKLKKLIMKDEKIVLRQYILSQKETTKQVKPSAKTKESPRELIKESVKETKVTKKQEASEKTSKKAVPVTRGKQVPIKREVEYDYSSSDSDYDSDES